MDIFGITQNIEAKSFYVRKSWAIFINDAPASNSWVNNKQKTNW